MQNQYSANPKEKSPSTLSAAFDQMGNTLTFPFPKFSSRDYGIQHLNTLYLNEIVTFTLLMETKKMKQGVLRRHKLGEVPLHILSLGSQNSY